MADLCPFRYNRLNPDESKLIRAIDGLYGKTITDSICRYRGTLRRAFVFKGKSFYLLSELKLEIRFRISQTQEESKRKATKRFFQKECF